MPTRVATKTQVSTTMKTLTAMVIAGAVLSSAAAGFAVVRENRQDVLENMARPYQTVGYVPGYVPGYIPGHVPGYGVPGYVPGYGWFEPLNAIQMRDAFRNWVRNLLSD